MRTFNNRGISAASLEDRPAELQVDEPVIAQSEPVAEGVPEEIIELNEASDAVDEKHEDVVELVDAAESLEALRVDVQSTLGERGLNPQAAKFMRHSLEAITSRLDIPVSMPSQEDFGTATSQTQATRVSLESMSSVISKVWEWALNLLESAKKSVLDYYNRVWAEAPRQIKKASELRTKAAANTGKAEESTFDPGTGLANKLRIGQKVENVSAGLGKLEEISGKIFKDYSAAATTWASNVTTAIAGLKYDSDEAFTTSLAAVEGVAPNAVPSGFADKAITGDKRFAERDGLAYHGSDELLGGQMVVKQTANAGADATFRQKMDVISNNTIRVDAADADAKKIEDSSKTALPDIAEIVKICEGVEKVAGIVGDFKSNWEATAKVKSEAIAKLKGAKSALGKSDKLSSENQSAATVAIKLIAAIPSVMDQPTQGFSKYVLGTNSSSLSFAAKALAQYK